MGSIWLTVAVEASKNAQAKPQLRGFLSTLMFEVQYQSNVPARAFALSRTRARSHSRARARSLSLPPVPLIYS